jgi:deoxyribodipyrimidine photo-lyase
LQQSDPAKVKQRIVRESQARTESGKYVLYWMQQAQRIHGNPALDYAVSQAYERRQPLLICFVISSEVPEAQAAHYRFMLEGIAELAKELKKLNLDFRVYLGNPVAIVSALAAEASLTVLDHGYLKWQRAWRDQLFDVLDQSSIVELDTEAVVPVHIASIKEEYSAATLRTKLLKLLPDYLSYADSPFQAPEMAAVTRMEDKRYQGDTTDITRLWADVSEALSMPEPHSKCSFKGGYKAALDKVSLFKKSRLQGYAQYRNHPELDYQSDLSPYLHFGQISPLDIIQRVKDDEDGFALRVLLAQRKKLSGVELNLADFLEELIVRRELSMNFCTYNEDYDSFACLPAWAKATLYNHLHDPRERQYSLMELENAATDDPYWNAAQNEMICTGKMHNYMRMYWGKRVLAWLENVEEAYEVLLYLNNKYSLDGRDANSYAGVAWCFGKHDRPWAERDIYGMVRYMNAGGLNRKFDMKAYLQKVESGVL